MSQEQESSILVPYTEETEASVWVVDRGLQLFSNIPEDTARTKAEFEQGHIFFFAELTSPDV